MRLLLVQNQIRRRDELFVTMRITHHRFLAQLCEAALYKRAQRLVIERGLPKELRRAYRFFQLRNRLQKFSLPRRASASANVYYGSGFTNGQPPPAYLPAHATFDLALGEDFGERFSASVNALNVANRHLLTDNSLTFGGFHWNNPREIYLELRYRFRY